MKKLLVLLIIITLISCQENKTAVHKERFTTPVELRQLVNSKESESYSSGFYFLIGGTYKSGTTTNVSVKVFAKINNYFRVVDIPIEDLRINIDNKLDKPTFSIGYYGKLLDDGYLIDNPYYNNVYIINCPEKYLPEKLLPIELN